MAGKLITEKFLKNYEHNKEEIFGYAVTIWNLDFNQTSFVLYRDINEIRRINKSINKVLNISVRIDGIIDKFMNITHPDEGIPIRYYSITVATIKDNRNSIKINSEDGLWRKLI